VLIGNLVLIGFKAMSALLLTVPAAVAPPLVTEPASYVNPFIGTSNLGNTYPGAVTPFGMLAFSPQESPNNQYSTVAPGGYQYAANRLHGFSLTHLSGVGCSGGNGDIPIMPYVGDVTTSPSSDLTDAVYGSTFAHANESAKPGYYQVGLDNGAGATLTATPRTGFGQFSFPAGKAASLLFRTSLSETGSADATVHIDAATRTVSGSVSAGNFCGPQSTNNSHAYYTLHFVAQLDTAFATTGTWTDAALTAGSTDAGGGSGYNTSGQANRGKGSGGYVTFAPGTTNVGVRVGISYVSEAGAAANLAAESPSRLSFNAIAAGARSAWSARLKKIGIGGGTEAQKRTFYTALYHAQLEPTLTSDVDGQYAGADGQPHALAAKQTAQYGTFSGWDVYRAQVQLLTMLDPKMASDFAQSLFNYATQRGGEWDRWLLEQGKTAVMAGDPSAAAVAAMYAFGARDFDAQGAFNSLVHAATVPTANDSSDAGCNVECVGQRPALDKYLTLGYVPADDCHCWGGASETLEDAAADYGLYQLGTALGDSRAPAFLDRSHNWKNVYDPSAQADPGLAHNIRLQIAAVTASAENAPYEGKAQAFDGDKGTKWLTFATTGWIQAQLKQPQTVTNYAITSGNDEPTRDPKDWTLQGSSDGTTWTTVDTQTAQSWTGRGQTHQFTVADPQPYLYYRLTITANNGAPIIQLAELELADPAVPTPVPADGPAKGWMRDRYSDGTWAEGFSPSTEAGFVEGTSARYTWMVYSDVVGLAAAMGGNQVAIQRLDGFFRNADGTFDLSAAKSTRFDATNEPDIQTPYLYNYFGAAAKTQETVRAILNGLWTDGTGGIPGNDDAGTMSAWYVLSALGLYPTVPTRAELALTSPLFPRAVFHLGSGQDLTIDAGGSGTYVQKLTVDGRSTTKAWLPASAVRTGGHLVYTLSDAPSPTWGSGSGDAPPQN
jgi:predicted alpha-1,2-mannosidase